MIVDVPLLVVDVNETPLHLLEPLNLVLEHYADVVRLAQCRLRLRRRERTTL